MKRVALFTRAWIEIISPFSVLMYSQVALFTRAWIEIKSAIYVAIKHFVALFTRAWIEIAVATAVLKSLASRPLHEGVD